MIKWEYEYTPTPVQSEAHAVNVDELLFGGAAGGGKVGGGAPKP